MTTLALGMPGPWEWLIIGVIGLLLFGRRLPEVGRSLGRGIVEFKKGLKGIEDDMEEGSSSPSPSSTARPTVKSANPQPALREPEQWGGSAESAPAAGAADAARPAT